MNGAGDWSGSAGTHGKAAVRGGLFALCAMGVVVALWASTGDNPLADFSGVGRAILSQARSIVAAPAVASTPFVTPGRFTRPLDGALR